MSRIAERFAALRAKGQKGLVLYVTAGDPSLDELPAILQTLQDAGADLLEIGIPFSDPIADGPTIQASTQRALDRGVTPIAVLESVKCASIGVPGLTMGYYNTALRLGLGRYASLLADAGLDGTIISDLIPEESGDWIHASTAADLDNVFLAAPTSTDDRLTEVCRRASGFVYAVSRTGVTGAGSEVPHEVQDLVRRIKSRTDLPVCVGFGISTPEHVRMVCEVADGAVIGSWLVDLLAREWQGGKGRQSVLDKVAALKEATR
jgi:tryptophan synthase alpha chain